MMLAEFLPLLMFIGLCAALMMGYPVALTLAGIALGFAGLGIGFDLFEPAYLRAFPNRILGAMRNQVLTSVPLFILMGVVLEQSGIARDLLKTAQSLLAHIRGGLAYAIVLVGALLAASTGIVGATVVTMSLIALPTMLKEGYDKRLSSGVIAASGTLGQIIPPSIVLIVLADVIANANADAARAIGAAPDPISVSDLFAGALVPGLLLVGAYLLLIALCVVFKPSLLPPTRERNATEQPDLQTLLLTLAAPIILILAVLGSILGGLASPTEAATIGAIGAIFLAGLKHAALSAPDSPLLWRLIGGGLLAFVFVLVLTALFDTVRGPGFALALAGCLMLMIGIGAAIWSLSRAGHLRSCLTGAAAMTSMVFLILIGAALFSIVFRGFGGDAHIEALLSAMPGGLFGALALSMLAMFILGFFLDFLEITFILVPLLAPQLILMGADPVWLAVLIAINLQTSFLTPPFGFALFYLKGAAPPGIVSTDIWRGALPFIALQLLVLLLVAGFPQLVWQPN